MSDILAVVVNWNGKADLAQILPSLLSQSVPVDVIVVDNGSTDDSESLVRKLGVAWLPLGANYGLAHAYNEGAKVSQSKYIAFMNNDLKLEGHCLENLTSALAARPDGLAADAVQLDWETGAPVHAATSFANAPLIDLEWWPPMLNIGIRVEQQDPRAVGEPTETAMASGAILAVRRELWEAIGGWDGSYPIGWEDVDLALRARAAGYRLYNVGTARCKHRLSASVSSERATVARLQANALGRCRILMKTGEWLPLFLAWVDVLARAAIDLGRRRPRRAGARVGGAWHGSRTALACWSSLPPMRTLLGPAPEDKLYVAGGAARGWGGQVALRSLLKDLRSRGAYATVGVPDGVSIPDEAHGDGIRLRKLGRRASLLAELVWLGRRDITYIGMSDRLPLIRRPHSCVMVLQNPHLYLRDPVPKSWRQVARQAVLLAWARKSAPNADRIVVATEVMREAALSRFGMSTAPISVRPIPPLDVPTRTRPLVDNIRDVCLVGDVYGYKRFDLAVRALDRWAAGLAAEIRVHHVGAPLEQEAWCAVSRAVEEVKHCSVSLLGSAPHHDVLALMANCDILVFPSARESYGLPLVEALAVGIPVACTDLPVFRELAGAAAVYFETESELIEAMAAVEPVSIRRRMVAVGREVVPPASGWQLL